MNVITHTSLKHCLSKGILSQQRIRHQDLREHIFRLLGRYHQLLFKWNP